MSLATSLDALPDEALVPVGWVRRQMQAEGLGLPSPFRVLTTGQASEEFGYSGDTWREWAEAGQVVGAYRDGEGGVWRLPYPACEEHLARLREVNLHKVSKRVPWAKKESRQTAQAGRTRASGVEAGQVVPLRPATVGRGQADHAGPDAPGMAATRRSHRGPGRG